MSAGAERFGMQSGSSSYLTGLEFFQLNRSKNNRSRNLRKLVHKGS